MSINMKKLKDFDNLWFLKDFRENKSINNQTKAVCKNDANGVSALMTQQA